MDREKAVCRWPWERIKDVVEEECQRQKSTDKSVGGCRWIRWEEPGGTVYSG